MNRYLARAFRVLICTLLVCWTSAANSLTDVEGNDILFSFVNRLNSNEVRQDQRSGIGRAIVAKRFGATLVDWIKKDYPRANDTLLDQAFVRNMKSRLKAMTKDDIHDLRKLDKADDLERALKRTFNAVAFYTIAENIDDPGNVVARRAWKRAPSGKYRTAPMWPALSQADWKVIESAALAHLDAVAWNSNLIADFYGTTGSDGNELRQDAWKLHLADNFTRDEMVAGIQAELEARFSREGTLVDPLLLRDFSELKYVMSGWERGWNNQPQLVAAMRLESLDADLADGRPVDVHLRMAELRNGFRPDVVHPTGYVEPADFAAFAEGGYSLLDIGSGPYHGDDTHSLQLFAFAVDQSIHPERYSRPVIDIVREISRIDRPARPDNRFEIENALSLWGAILDLAGTNNVVHDFSHPDGTLNALRDHGQVPRLARQLSNKASARSQFRSRLLNAVVQAHNEGRDYFQMFPWITEGGTDEDTIKHWINRAASNTATPQEVDVAGDLLYSALYFSRLRVQNSDLVSIDLGDGPIPALIDQRALPLNKVDPVFDEGLERARQRLETLKRSRQQEPSGAVSSTALDVPSDIATASVHYAAAMIDDGYDTEIESFPGFEEDNVSEQDDFSLQDDNSVVSDADIAAGYGVAEVLSQPGATEDPLQQDGEEDQQDESDGALASDSEGSYDDAPPPENEFDRSITVQMDVVVQRNLETTQIPVDHAMPVDNAAEDLNIAARHDEALIARLEGLSPPEEDPNSLDTDDVLDLDADSEGRVREMVAAE